MTAAWLALRDDPLPDDADLLPPLPAPAAPGTTTIDLLVEIVAELPPDGDWRLYPRRREDGSTPESWPKGPFEREAWLDPETAELDRAHFEGKLRPLDRVGEAVARERFGWEIPDLERFWVPDPAVVDRIRVELEARALWHRVQGDVAAASRDLELQLLLCERLTASCTPGISPALHAQRLHRQAISRFESLLHDGDIDPEVEARTIARAPMLTPERGVVMRLLLEEYRWRRAAYLDDEKVAVGRLPRIAYKPRRTVRELEAIVREVLADAERLPHDRTLDPDGSRSSMAALHLRALLRLNSGEYWLDFHRVNFAQTLGWFDLLHLEETALRLLLALRRYERLHGELPPDLDALVAAIPELGRVPRDPYSGEPLRYDPARRIFWSEWRNGIDDGAPGWDPAQFPGTARVGESPLDRVWWVPLPPEPTASTPR